MKLPVCLCVLLALAATAFAHDISGEPARVADATNAVPLPFAVEKRGPVRAPKTLKLAPGQKVSGQGFWKFIAARELTPVPFISRTLLTNAHGTIIVDKAADTVFWGLQGVGWIGFSNRLSASWLVQGDPVFTNGNLHGADILPRHGKPPLVAATDNVGGHVYLTDANFQHAEILERPDQGPYATNSAFRPTDVAFTGEKEMWVVDGYARQRLIPVEVSPLRYEGKFFGGKNYSQTLHGVTYDPREKSLLLSARYEGQLKWFDAKHGRIAEIAGLPPGSTICDVDIWGDYALAPCLDGPDKTAGPIYIINLKKRAIVATIKPMDDLGYEDAQHIHDAAWYVTGKGREQEVFIVFTNWRPGGIGALKLVNVAE